MRKLITLSLVSAMVLYMLTGLAAYARFGEALLGDVLINLAAIDSTAVRFVRLFFGVSICLTYPCLHYATRHSLNDLLWKASRSGAPAPYRRLFGLTVGIVGSTLAIGLVVEKVEMVFGFTGAIASTMITFMLPAAIHLRLRPHKVTLLRTAHLAPPSDEPPPWVLTSPAFLIWQVRLCGSKSSWRKNCGTFSFLVVGVFIACLGLVNHASETFHLDLL